MSTAVRCKHALTGNSAHVPDSMLGARQAAATAHARSLHRGIELIRGDLNCDTLIDFDDIDPFVLALADPTGYQATYPHCDWLAGDCNGDEQVDFDDIDPFVALLSGGAQVQKLKVQSR